MFIDNEMLLRKFLGRQTGMPQLDDDSMPPWVKEVRVLSGYWVEVTIHEEYLDDLDDIPECQEDCERPGTFIVEPTITLSAQGLSISLDLPHGIHDRLYRYAEIDAEISYNDSWLRARGG